jgi:hypothetical protein
LLWPAFFGRCSHERTIDTDRQENEVWNFDLDRRPQADPRLLLQRSDIAQPKHPLAGGVELSRGAATLTIERISSMKWKPIDDAKRKELEDASIYLTPEGPCLKILSSDDSDSIVDKMVHAIT